MGALTTDSAFVSASHDLLDRVQRAFRAVLSEASCVEAMTAADLQRALGLDKKLGWQVYRVINASNALAAGFAVPSMVSMRRIVVAAGARGAGDGACRELLAVVDEFHRFVRDNSASRAEFESIIAAWSPEDREAVDLAARRDALSAMSRLRGVACRATFYTFLLHPSRDGRSVDRVLLQGHLGLRRLRMSARMLAETLYCDEGRGADAEERTLGGDPITDPQALLLGSFCSSPTPVFETRFCDPGQMLYWLSGNDIGARSAVDLVFAFRRERNGDRYASEERPTATYFTTPSTPTPLMLFDCLVHRDLYDRAEPEVRVYETAANGSVASPLDVELREPDRLDWVPPLERIESGFRKMACAAVPRYDEMLRRVCTEMAWEPSDFRCDRLEIECPVHSWQVAVTYTKRPG